MQLPNKHHRKKRLRYAKNVLITTFAIFNERGYTWKKPIIFLQMEALPEKIIRYVLYQKMEINGIFRFENISDIYIFSEINLNISLLNLLSKMGISVHFFNYYQYYIGSFYPKEQKLAGKLLTQQAEHYLNPEKRLFLAQAFINSASYNIFRNLRYYNGRGKNVQPYMDQIVEYRKYIPKTESITELMGIEGNIRKTYYQAWNTIIDQNIDFSKRVMRPPDNMINSLISFVNSLIYTKVLTEIYKTQINPTISYLHEPGAKRFSLALDISEIFKPLIGDRLIFSLLNRNQITEQSFVNELNGLQLKKSAVQTIVEELDTRLQTNH